MLGLDTSLLDAKNDFMTPVDFVDHPFVGEREVKSRGKGHIGLARAIAWFAGHGFAVSVPLEPATYDLIADSGGGLCKVQVKTSIRTTSVGNYYCRLTRSIYDPSVPLNARGRYRNDPYTADEVDFFFIVTGDNLEYLIPQDVVDGLEGVAVTKKYAAFAV